MIHTDQTLQKGQKIVWCVLYCSSPWAGFENRCAITLLPSLCRYCKTFSTTLSEDDPQASTSGPNINFRYLYGQFLIFSNFDPKSTNMLFNEPYRYPLRRNFEIRATGVAREGFWSQNPQEIRKSKNTLGAFRIKWNNWQFRCSNNFFSSQWKYNWMSPLVPKVRKIIRFRKFLREYFRYLTFKL